MQLKSYLGGEKKGVYAIRTPFRPIPIGLWIFENMGIKENIVNVKGLDALDRTPVLDIKPYVSESKVRNDAKNGWLNKTNL